jgi:hypothetical protein
MHKYFDNTDIMFFKIVFAVGAVVFTGTLFI